ncbi:Exodeoxyribonuclease V beta chain [Raoultella planticola]|uniref:Exodeoxyribonuclease V beta chain n=1 Tax=Raoultella planticola TaxID=575 RepID=A0A485BVH9_RAOPL|nr:Exodeoxyribonuclease V beta chain [Raoultella planticola]
MLENSGLDRRKFNRGNQGKWIEKINAWAQEETLGYQLPDALEKFSQAFLHERTKAGGEPPVHPLFSAVEELLSSPLTADGSGYRQGDGGDPRSGRPESVGAASSVLMTCSVGWMMPLRGESGEALASAIRQRFPVAMIDEFQDTDPQQYRFFAVSGGSSRRRRCCLSATPSRPSMPSAARIFSPI